MDVRQDRGGPRAQAAIVEGPPRSRICRARCPPRGRIGRSGAALRDRRCASHPWFRASPSSCSRSGLGPHVVARTGFCIHPREARRVPKVGGTKDPDLAMLRALAPTHLVVNVDENRREDVDAAREFVPNVVVTHPLVPSDNLRAVRDVRRDVRLRSACGRPRRRARGISCVRARGDACRPARARALSHLAQAVDDGLARDVRERVARPRRVGHACPPRRTCAIPRSATTTARGGMRSASSCRRSRTRSASATLRELKERQRKPVALVDGEWTSWYGPRAASGLRALARAARYNGTRCRA